METVIEPQYAPVDTPAETTAPAPANDVQALLDEFAQGTAQPEPAPDNTQADLSAVPDNLDQQLAELLGPQSDPLAVVNEQARTQIAELQGANAQLQAERQREIDQRDFDKFASDLQAELPSHLPPEYAANALWAAAAKDRHLIAAFDARGQDPKAAEAEFRKLEILYDHVLRGPDDPRKQTAIAAIERRGLQLEYAMHSREILRRARADIVKQARAHPVIDEDATATRADIAWAVKDGGSGRPMAAEPAPRLGNLTNQEFREYTRKHYGF